MVSDAGSKRSLALWLASTCPLLKSSSSHARASTAGAVGGASWAVAEKARQQPTKAAKKREDERKNKLENKRGTERSIRGKVRIIAKGTIIPASGVTGRGPRSSHAP